jgi:hypothetical protein
MIGSWDTTTTTGAVDAFGGSREEEFSFFCLCLIGPA